MIKRHILAGLLSFSACAGLLDTPASAAGETQAPESAPTARPSQVALKALRDAAHRLRRAALDVINDVEQRDMVVTGEPLLIQPIAMKDDNKPVGWAQMMEDLGPALPPRKSWLDRDIANVGELVALIKDDIATVKSGDESDLPAAAHWQDIKAVVADIETHYNNLASLGKGPKYDNIAIGKEALKIYDDVGRLEKPWKEAVHAARK